MKCKFFLAILMVLCLASCVGHYNPPQQYQLTTVSQKQLALRPSNVTLLISQPIPVLAYQSADMLYVSKDYNLEPFIKNSWDVPPSEMLFPLITQSIRNTQYFSAVIPAPTFAYADWRLDSYLIKLNQDFTHKPSIVELELNATLINNITASVIANKQFHVEAIAPEDTPYGGVVAANMACQQLMEELSVWVVDTARRVN